MVFSRRQQRTGRQPHQVHRVGEEAGLVEIVDSPHQPPIGISPGAEVLHVQVADRQETRHVIQFRAHLGPYLHPTIESRPKEWKKGRRHLLVLEPQIGLDNSDVQSQPILEPSGGLNDVHSCFRQ